MLASMYGSFVDTSGKADWPALRKAPTAMLSTLLGMPSNGATIEVRRRLRAAVSTAACGLLVDRQIWIAAELGKCCCGVPLQAGQIGVRGLQVAYRGVE